jgi:hypothetical protein
VKSIPVVILATVTFIMFGFVAPVHAAAIRFLCLNEELAARDLGVQDTKGTTKLKDLSALKRSDAHTCATGDSPLLLVAMDRKGADGKSASVEIALPAGLKAPLVLILPDPDHASGLRALAVDDSETGFPWGSLRFINITDQVLVIRYEQETKPFPASPAVVDVALTGEARNMGVQLSKEDDPESVLYSAVWEYDPAVRKLVFVLPGNDPATAAVELKVIPDQRPAK